MIVGIFFVIIIFILLAAFFSGMETGLISINKFKLEKESKNDSVKAGIKDFIENPNNFLGTTLLGTNISVVIVTSVFIAYFVENKKYLSDESATIIIAAILLIFAEIIPKAIYRDNANFLVPKTYHILKFFYYLFRPFAFCLTWITDKLLKLVGINEQNTYFKITREDLSYLVSATKSDDLLQTPQKEMLEDVLEFNELTAKNVMIPRIEMSAVSHNTNLKELIKTAQKEGFTRYPVFKENLDQIIGIFIIHDIIGVEDLEKHTANDFIRQAYFIPENMDVQTILRQMQLRKKSMAIVVDSYGGTAGLVTTEDIIEEIVGEIEDEYDTEEAEKEIKKINENTYEIRGFVEIDVLNDEYHFNFPEGDYETLAGFIIDQIGRIPLKGFTFNFMNKKMEIMEVTGNRIDKVRLFLT
jgi:CBS domain containing-hemolysin-like protein